MTLQNKFIWLILLILGPLSSCGVYSFTGASIAPDIQTISIQRFIDEVGAGPPTMSQIFTEAIRDYYQQNTNLTLVDDNGDLQIEGSITGYRVAPLAPTASGNQNFNNADVAGLQRLTITVRASYINTKDDSFDFDKTFSFYRDYDPEREPLRSNEQDFIDEIFEQIILDIFNSSVANW
jgi:hypothetical protein